MAHGTRCPGAFGEGRTAKDEGEELLAPRQCVAADGAVEVTPEVSAELSLAQILRDRRQ